MCLKSTIGPGPGAYKMPTTVGHPNHDPSRYRMPMYSFGIRGGFGGRLIGPGPAYKIDRVTREGNMFAPQWSFGIRGVDRAVLKVPGPGAHAPERCPVWRGPSYSLGARPPDGRPRIGPAANAYNTRGGASGPAYSMAARLGFASITKSPGPAVYFQKDNEVYMTRAPRYSLASRFENRAATRTPGPAAYPPQLYDTKKNSYKYSFGTKHSPCAPPMIVTQDTMDCL